VREPINADGELAFAYVPGTTTGVEIPPAFAVLRVEPRAHSERVGP
jgi:hypothetical protein